MKLDSLALFVGTDECNARCKHCAGIPLRKYAPKKDGIIDKKLVYDTVKKCYGMGARRLSLTSCGEPTLSPLSVTKTLKLIKDFKFSTIHLYSNGIRIGEDKDFCNEYLSLWEKYGLTTAYITVHNTDMEKNARVYGVENYPPLELIVSRIHDAGLTIRANIILSKQTVYTFSEYKSTIEHLLRIGVDNVSSWPLKKLDDTIDVENSPPEKELDKMNEWIKKYDGSDNLIRLIRKENNVKKTALILFPDGTLSNTWCNS